MSKKSILPIADPSALSLSYLHEMRVRGQGLYIMVVCAVVLALAILPFVYVDVSVRGGGLIQATVGKSDVVLPTTGKVAYLAMRENLQVEKGDTLLHIDASGGRQQDLLVSARIAELQQLIADIERINEVAASNAGQPATASQQYMAAWEQYSQQRYNARRRMEQAGREHGRYEKLYGRKIISAAEYEKYQTAYEQAKAEYSIVARQFRSQWAAEASGYRAELNELYRQRAEWKNQETFYTLVAPIAGTLQNLAGIQEGAPVFANQKIAELSPDSSIVAIVHVGAADIGLVKRGQDVRLQIDAFNYNQWGLVSARVHEIADDMVLDANSQPVFLVRCTLNDDHLR